MDSPLSNVAAKVSHDFDLDAFIMDQLASTLNVAVQELLASENESKEIQLPSSLSLQQVDYVLNQLSQTPEVQVEIKWFFPVLIIVLKKKSSTLSLLPTVRHFKVRLSLPAEIREQIFKLAMIKLKRNSPYVRTSDSQPSNFSIITYINTEPIVPTKLALKYGDTRPNLASSLPGLTEADHLLLEAITGVNRIHVLTGMSKADKLNLTILLHNEACLQKMPCRIIYLQSTSILTFWMALAVKGLCGEYHWNSSGYQITLESKSSPNNNIIFFELTTFIRALNRGIETSLVTHLVVDIDHQHFFFNLFLLYLKENFDQLRHMKVLIFARNKKHAVSLKEYFASEEVNLVDHIEFFNQVVPQQMSIAVPPRSPIDITHLYLDDIANFTPNFILEMTGSADSDSENRNVEMERLMFEIHSRDFELKVMIEFIVSFPALVNYQCTQLNGITPLILAVLRGTVNDVYRILVAGANCHLASWNGLEPIEWAIQAKREDIFHLLFVHCYATNESFDLNLQRYYSERFLASSTQTAAEMDIKPGAYLRKAIAQPPLYQINYQLILHLLGGMIRQINQSTPHSEPMGCILILLPSYNKISTLRKLIISDLASIVEYPFTIFCLYPHLPNNELDIALDLLKQLTTQVRVILSTLTLDSLLLKDIRYVINSGVLLEKVQSAYAPISLYRLVSNETTEKQGEYRHYGDLFDRKSTVYFYNLFWKKDVLNDRAHSNSFSPANHETDSIYHCIFALKCLNLRTDLKIRAMFERMICQPRRYIVEHTVQSLRELNMLDDNEHFTELGRTLIDLSIEPHYAKMIIYSVLLRCLDPILTVVCALSSPNCFELSSSNSEKRSLEMKYLLSLSGNSYSDHLTYVYAFQKWQELCRSNPKNVTYDKSGIILFSSFELIYSLRTKILGQLRACGFVKGKGAMNIRQLNTNSDNFTLVKAAICAGQSLHNFALIEEASLRLIRPGDETSTSATFFHPNSVLSCYMSRPHTSASSLPSSLVMFDRQVACGSAAYLENCTLLNPLTVAIFANESHPGAVVFKPNCIHFNTGPNGLRITGDDVARCFDLRLRWQQFAFKRISNMHASASEEETGLVNDLLRLCSLADEHSGFCLHPNIGRAPQVMSTYFCSTKMIPSCRDHH